MSSRGQGRGQGRGRGLGRSRGRGRGRVRGRGCITCGTWQVAVVVMVAEVDMGMVEA